MISAMLMDYASPRRRWISATAGIVVGLFSLANAVPAFAAVDNTYDLKIGPGDSFFGTTSGAGDFNNDGYDDLAVGEYFYSSSKGRVSIFFGTSTGLPTTADLTIVGASDGDRIGQSLAAAGDVNNDGYEDLLVGGTGYNSLTGREYIFYGGASMDTTADVTFTGESTGDRLGYRASAAGDVNNDGFDDVIVGAIGYSSFTGRAYIYLGGSSMDNTADVTLTGEASGNYFAASTAGGDFNNDGYSDVIVGAYQYSSNTGRAYVYYGGASMDNVADVTMTGETTNNYFGAYVTGGDIDNDGYDDAIVGATFYSNDTGRVYIFRGSASLDNTADVTLTGNAEGDELGYPVTVIGDVNDDGYNDVFVGAIAYPDSNFTGQGFVYYGGSPMDTAADITFDAEHDYDEFGVSGTAGDFNDDGANDLVIGADCADNGACDGAVYVYNGVPAPASSSSSSSAASSSSSSAPSGGSGGHRGATGNQRIIQLLESKHQSSSSSSTHSTPSPSSNVSTILQNVRERLAARIEKRIAEHPSLETFLLNILKRLDERIARMQFSFQP
jgi:hypothetical protein